MWLQRFRSLSDNSDALMGTVSTFSTGVSKMADEPHPKKKIENATDTKIGFINFIYQFF